MVGRWAIWSGLIGLLLGGECAAQQGVHKTRGLPVVYVDDFQGGNLQRWEFADEKAWRLLDLGGNKVLDQFQQSMVQTPVRSPFNRSLVKGLVLGSFQLDVDLKSTVKDYDHRSLVVFFGYQDPAHMHYVHFGKKTDDHANQIFIVNNAPRVKISTKTTPGTPWDDAWHHVRVARDVSSGVIEVYFDNMEEPVMTAVDKTFVWGQVGVGSFDDAGYFDNLVVRGEVVERK